jgi:hypothetical protein
MTESPDSPRLTWSGRYSDSATERAFRDAQFRDDFALTRVLILCVLAMDAAFLPFDVDWHASGVHLSRQFWIRLGACAVSLIAYLALGRATRPEGVTWVLSAWFSPALALNVAPLFVGGAGALSSAAPYAVAIVLIYFLPLPLWFRFLNGLALAGSHFAAVTLEGWPANGPFTIVDVVAGFVAAKALGL